MIKRIFSVCFCLCLILSMGNPAAAVMNGEESRQHETITDLAHFLTFSEQCRLDSFSRNLSVSLETDLDLSGMDFESIPIFCGTFEGNGHTIRGLTLDGEGSVQGLFRYLTETAVVQNLHLEVHILPGGGASDIGALAGRNEGTITGCDISGIVSGSEYVGGIAGRNLVSGIIQDCRVEGTLSGNHFVGGIAGENYGVIRNCSNEAEINTTPQQNSVKLSEITLDSLTQSESANTVTDVGGIAGSSMGVIRDCKNLGTIGYRHMGYNIGGIAGTQSGYIADSVNHGQIQGRKEVGGIVGQMEPTALIEYKEDAIQILQRQLDGMGSIVSTTAGNVQAGAQALSGQVNTLYGQVVNAKDAVETLLPNEDNMIPDRDTIHAAQNNISSSISGMSHTLQGMSATTQTMAGVLSNNLHAMQSQMNAMRATMGNMSETLGGTLRDVSDDDTDQDLMGKVQNCVNHGCVTGDLNVGGIAGAIAMENDLDYKDDVQISGNNSLNFDSQLRSVILNCGNEAAVAAGKQNAGGIVGLQSMGLVKDSLNAGTLEAEEADHVGGISGQSMGFIRSSGAKCQISGSNYVGGIAGSATSVTDCMSMVKLNSGREKLGAVLGMKEDSPTVQEEHPVAGNYYLSVGEDVGAIDGISYAGVAQPMEREAFLKQEGLPALFRNVTVRFCYENGGETRFTMVPGDAFPEEKIPAIPKKSGYAASWKGLDVADLSCVMFDMTFEADYSGHQTVLEGGTLRGQRPLMLAQGSFGDAATLTVEPWDADLTVASGETLLEVWRFAVADANELTTMRLALPEEMQPEDLRLMLWESGGSWREAEHTVDGSYLVFYVSEGDSGVALIQTADYQMILTAAAVVLVLVLLILLLWKKKMARIKKV